MLDAWATEQASAYLSRRDVIKHIEDHFDALRPQEERLKDWGKQMTLEQAQALRKGPRG